MMRRSGVVVAMVTMLTMSQAGAQKTIQTLDEARDSHSVPQARAIFRAIAARNPNRLSQGRTGSIALSAGQGFCMDDSQLDCGTGPTVGIPIQSLYFGYRLFDENSLTDEWWAEAYRDVDTWFDWLGRRKQQPWDRDPRLTCGEKLNLCVTANGEKTSMEMKSCEADGLLVGAAITLAGGVGGFFIGGVGAGPGASGGLVVGTFVGAAVTATCVRRNKDVEHPMRYNSCMEDKRICDGSGLHGW